MPIEIEQLPGESIIFASVKEPFVPERDVPLMFKEFLPLRMTMQGNVALIVDLAAITNAPDAFSRLVMVLAEAGHGIKVHKASGVASPPILIFVGTGPVADIAAQAIDQDQYGGVKADLCASRDEAVALARTKVSA